MAKIKWSLEAHLRLNEILFNHFYFLGIHTLFFSPKGDSRHFASIVLLICFFGLTTTLQGTLG